jgi:uncharacterized protein YjbI with pentapeptide repeats
MTAEEFLERYEKGERDFSGVDLIGINIGRGYARELLEQYQVGESAWVGGANLVGINLSGANLESADFEGADLMGANLTEASLAVASFSVVRFDEADLSSVNVTFD